MDVARRERRTADRPWSVYRSAAIGSLVALATLSVPMVNVLAPLLGGSVAGLFRDGGPVEGLVVGAFAGVLLVVPAWAVSVLLGLAGMSVSTIVGGAGASLDLVVVWPSGIVVYRVSAFALLTFGVMFGLSGGIIGGSAREAFV